MVRRQGGGMSEQTPDEVMASAFMGLAGSVQQAMMADGLARYEYAMVPVEELNDHGADRWRVVPVPPAQEITLVLGQPKAGPLTYLMERSVLVGEADDALRPTDYNGFQPGGM
jgi:hypothetical protein